MNLLGRATGTDANPNRKPDISVLKHNPDRIADTRDRNLAHRQARLGPVLGNTP